MPRGHYLRKPKPEQDPPRVDPPLPPHHAPVPKAPPPPPPSLADGFCAALAASTAKDVAELDAKIKQLGGTLESYRMLRDLLAAKHGLPHRLDGREQDRQYADRCESPCRAPRKDAREQDASAVFSYRKGDLVRYGREEWEVVNVSPGGLLTLEMDNSDGTTELIAAVGPSDVTLIKSALGNRDEAEEPEPIIAGKPLTEVLREEGLEEPVNGKHGGVKLTVEQRRANVVQYLRNQPDNSVPRAALFRLKIVPPSLSRVILEHPWFVVDRLGQISLTPLGAQEGPRDKGD